MQSRCQKTLWSTLAAALAAVILGGCEEPKTPPTPSKPTTSQAAPKAPAAPAETPALAKQTETPAEPVAGPTLKGPEKANENAPPAPKAPEKVAETAPPAPKAPEKVAETAPPAPKAPEKVAETAPPPVKAPEAPVAKAPEAAPAKTPEAPAAAKPAEMPPAAVAVAMEVKIPLGLPPLPVPANNPMTVDKVALGRQLYFDTRVSKDGSVSCATCHDPKMAWAEHDPTSSGIHKQLGGRNAPTVINAAYATTQFWDGRAPDLEAQATGPVENPIEMGHSMETLVEQFNKLPGYRQQFEKVFGTGVTKEGFAKAVAAFERTVLSGDSAYDRFTKSDDKKALSDQQQQGLKLFEENCSTCHTPPLFSSFRFYNAGIGMDKPKPDEGRKAVTKDDADLGKFRVPALRDVAQTGPYFHDGSVARLEEAVAIMAGGGKDNPKLAAQMKVLREAKLTAEDQTKLVAFLQGLSGKFPLVEPPKMPE